MRTEKYKGAYVQTLLFLFPFRTLIFILYPTLSVLLHGVRQTSYNADNGRDTMCTAVVIRAYCDRHHFTKHVKREQKRNYLNNEKHNKKHEI